MAHKEQFDAQLQPGGKRGINWFESKTPYGYNIAECVSAVVKEIRRAKEKEAIFWGHQVAISGSEAEDFLWEILRVVCIEDISVANPQAIAVINGAKDLYFDLPDRDDRRFAALAFGVTYLARSPKSRYSTELYQVMTTELREDGYRPDVPDYALDLHVPRGKDLGRGLLHYLTVASHLENEDTSLPTDARDWLIAHELLKQEELADYQI